MQMRLLPAIALVLLLAPEPAAAGGGADRAAIRVEARVVSRCLVITAPGGDTRLRCTRGAAAPAIGTPRGPEPLVLERAAPGRVTASAAEPVSGGGRTRLVTIQF